jgi:Retroviral aspartyl protease
LGAIENQGENPPGNTVVVGKGKVRLLTFIGTIEGHHARLLFDTGATNCFVAKSFVGKYDITTYSIRKTTVSLVTKSSTMSIDKAIVGMLQIQNYKEKIGFLVTDIDRYDGIIGMDWFMRIKPELDWNPLRKLIIHSGKGKRNIKIVEEEGQGNVNAMEVSSLQLKRDLRKSDSEGYLALVFQV